MSGRQSIEFDQLSYSVKGFFDRAEIQILKNVSGEFRGYELSAILGPSGSGKSTLLNILSGFTTKGVQGSIRVNGEARNEETFKKQSTFIMQEENLVKLLTLWETMNYAMKLKTGRKYNAEEQKIKIMSILETLGIDNHLQTLVKNLSGGQQKRLSIAMELVDDPKIIFLDEPSTGLDSLSSFHCISLLKKLAREGRTIICTIHQPSALIFEMFDHIYGLVEGSCIYQGTCHNLITFLTENDLVCPVTYNPADFLLEIATGVYGPQNEKLSKVIENGLSNNYRETPKSIELNEICDSNSKNRTSTSFFYQVALLISRNMLFSFRERNYMLLRILVPCYIGVMVGLMYYKIGNQAEQMINIYKSFLVLLVVQLYISMYSLMVRFPLDLPIIRREHFNGWYSVGAHYISLVLTDFPITLTSSILFNVIACAMMDHPIDAFRFLPILSIGIIMSFTAQAYGIFAGSFVEIKLTVLFAALLMLFQIVFAGGLVFMKDTSSFWYPFFQICFLKHAFDGYTTYFLGFNRTKLHCEEMYCYLEDPKKLLNLIGMDAYIPRVFYSLFIILFAFHFIAYFVMRYRVTSQSFFDKIKI